MHTVPETTEQLTLAFPAQPLPADTWDGAHQAADNADTDWLSCAERAIRHLARSGQPFTADDFIPLVPRPDHPNRIGGVFRRAYAAGVIEPTGNAKPSTTTSRRGGLLREWKGTVVA